MARQKPPRFLLVGTERDPSVKAMLDEIEQMLQTAGVPHLTSREYCRLYHTDIARKLYGIQAKEQIYAIPPKELWTNIVAFGLHCWAPLRLAIGSPLFLRNGYRPPQYNRIARGSGGSRHQWAQAGDIYPLGGVKIRDLRDAAIDLVLDRKGEPYGIGLYGGNIHIDWGYKFRFWGSRMKEFTEEKKERAKAEHTPRSMYLQGGVS